MRNVVLLTVLLLLSGVPLMPQTPKPAVPAPAAKTTPAPAAKAPAAAAAPAAAKAPVAPAAKATATTAAKAPVAAPAAAELEKLKAEQEKAKAAQVQQAAQIDQAKDVVRNWFRRWNSLDGSEESINEFIGLYKPDAEHITGPADDVIGTAFYEGQERIRRLAQHVSEEYCRQAYYIKMRTSTDQVGDDGGAKIVDLMTAAPSPFGGISVGVEIGASYDYRDSKKRFMAPGAAFFDIKDGKIARLRVYYSKGENFEVDGQGGCKSSY